MGHPEIWRSLQTDSLKISLRRLPNAMARVETEIEHRRWAAGLHCDPTLLEPLSDDAVAKRQVIHDAAPVDAEPVPPVPASKLTLGETYEQYDRSDAGVVSPNAGGL
ncbi:hypothetical protein MU848_11655 [Sphingobium sp. MAH-33]|uniref:Uncharacterized protein n=2 Tax=Sphingomonadaceae TaxID=41297 RepID=A0ABT0DYN7_9SPHN|nr:hypothetical protein [Sphingobium agri]